MGKGRKRLSGAKRREIKKKWKARTFLERDSESSEDNGKMNDEEKKAPPPLSPSPPPPSPPPPPPPTPSASTEQDKGARVGKRGGSREHTLWPGCLFDSHCHLNMVLR